jgi:hypothetical protein
MFSLTANATTELKAARIASGIPETWGIRFFAPVRGQADVTFRFVHSPEPGDIVGGSDQLHTYVALEVNERHGDATVDFRIVDGRSNLTIRPYLAGRARK